MKKLLKNYNFEDYFDPLILSCGKNYYKENRILDIWCQDDIKNPIRKDMAYNKLLDIYDEKVKLEEKKKILPEVIIETNSFKKYKELKEMYSDSEWKSIKENIVSKIKPNNIDILEDIYMEENENDKYNKELLNFYKPQILEKSKRVTDRKWYQELCNYIRRMGELNNSDDFIFDMLKEMYPNYRSKKAFKEEIMKVLSAKNQQRFYELINS